jgi:hypothetical protein
VAAIFAELEDLHKSAANGTAKTYKTASELRAALDAEDESEDE